MRKPPSSDRALDRTAEPAKLPGEVEVNVARPGFLGARLFAACANTGPHSQDAARPGRARIASCAHSSIANRNIPLLESPRTHCNETVEFGF
jgi:hypothetical protein